MKAGTIERICQTVMCPICRAAVGQRCVTTSGRRRGQSHSKRQARVQWKIDAAIDARCPVHGIPDCSPLLNGCTRVTSPTPRTPEGD